MAAKIWGFLVCHADEIPRGQLLLIRDEQQGHMVLAARTGEWLTFTKLYRIIKICKDAELVDWVGFKDVIINKAPPSQET